MSSRASRGAVAVAVAIVLLSQSALARADILVLGSSAHVSGQLTGLNGGPGASIGGGDSQSGTGSVSFAVSQQVGGDPTKVFAASGGNTWADPTDVFSIFNLSYPDARSVQVQAVYSYTFQTDQDTMLVLNPLSIQLLDAGPTLVVSWPDGTSNSYPGDLSRTGPLFQVAVHPGTFTVSVFLNNNVGGPEFGNRAAARSSSSDYELSITPMPEPPGLVLFGLGALGLAGWGWLRKTRALVAVAPPAPGLGAA